MLILTEKEHVCRWHSHTGLAGPCHPSSHSSPLSQPPIPVPFHAFHFHITLVLLFSSSPSLKRLSFSPFQCPPTVSWVLPPHPPTQGLKSHTRENMQVLSFWACVTLLKEEPFKNSESFSESTTLSPTPYWVFTFLGLLMCPALCLQLWDSAGFCLIFLLLHGNLESVQ